MKFKIFVYILTTKYIIYKTKHQENWIDILVSNWGAFNLNPSRKLMENL